MHQARKKELSESHEYLTCPFCMNQCVEARQGETRCPDCYAVFEIDDRAECVFGGTNEIKLPVIGIICAFCGLIQVGEDQNCLYCGSEINTAVH